MKNKIFGLSLIFFVLIFGTYSIYGADKIKFTDNSRIYEPINVSNTKGVSIQGENSIDFSKSEANSDILNGSFSGDYTIKSLDENKTVKLGFIVSSSLKDFEKFSLKSGDSDLNYNIKILSDRFLQSNGTEFYKEVLKGLDSKVYEPTNFKMDSKGLLRTFKLESTDSEKLEYEITVTYNGNKSKVFATGGKSISGDFEKDNKTMKITHELGGNYQDPSLYVIGDNVVVNTKVMVNGKEITTGYKEKIDRSNVPVITYMKDNFMTDVPESVKNRLTDENLFELFAENFDKILNGVSKDTIGLLNSNSVKTIFVTTDLQVDKNEKKILAKYPISAGVTTINNSKVMKLNMEVSPLETFSNFSGINYNVIGNENYKYVISSNAEYKTIDLGSIIKVKDTSKKLIENLMYKESYLKGISKEQPSKFSGFVIVLVGFIEIVGVIYLRNLYKFKFNKRKNY